MDLMNYTYYRNIVNPAFASKTGVYSPSVLQAFCFQNVIQPVHCAMHWLFLWISKQSLSISKVMINNLIKSHNLVELIRMIIGKQQFLTRTPDQLLTSTEYHQKHLIQLIVVSSQNSNCYYLLKN
tara:strand:+ start:506 stop:880 length:375 start_codon:yes stop_codon:yes gene_type:complete